MKVRLWDKVIKLINKLALKFCPAPRLIFVGWLASKKSHTGIQTHTHTCPRQSHHESPAEKHVGDFEFQIQIQ